MLVEKWLGNHILYVYYRDRKNMARIMRQNRIDAII